MTYLLGAIGLIVIGLLIIIFRKSFSSKDNQASLLLKQDYDNLTREISSLKDSLNNQLGQRLDKDHEIIANSVQRQFQESTKLINEVTRSLTELKESNKQVLNITEELKTLQNVLQNPKQRGVLGEYYLSSLLENVLPPDKFKLQYKIGKNEDNQDLICDAVIILDKGTVLPVDSKFSLENYNRMLEEANVAKKDDYAKQFRADLKKRIDETSKYIKPEYGTMDFAFMFIPSEAIYYDLLINKISSTTVNSRDLIEYAFREKSVIIVSPTSFLAYLQTVLQGLRSLHIEEQAKVIQKRVMELERHLTSYQGMINKVGSSLSSTVGHFNNAHKELVKIDKDVLKITGSKATPIDSIVIDRPTLDND